jgi:hypothetical protein
MKISIAKYDKETIVRGTNSTLPLFKDTIIMENCAKQVIYENRNDKQFTVTIGYNDYQVAATLYDVNSDTFFIGLEVA